MTKINIRKWAEQYGYKVEIDRHGVYTNYCLTNDRGCIRIEKSNFKGHKPWIVWADYKIRIPVRYNLMFNVSMNANTIVQQVSECQNDFADLTEDDIIRIIVNNAERMNL